MSEDDLDEKNESAADPSSCVAYRENSDKPRTYGRKINNKNTMEGKAVLEKQNAIEGSKESEGMLLKEALDLSRAFKKPIPLTHFNTVLNNDIEYLDLAYKPQINRLPMVHDVGVKYTYIPTPILGKSADNTGQKQFKSHEINNENNYVPISCNKNPIKTENIKMELKDSTGEAIGTVNDSLIRVDIPLSTFKRINHLSVAIHQALCKLNIINNQQPDTSQEGAWHLNDYDEDTLKETGLEKITKLITLLEGVFYGDLRIFNDINNKNIKSTTQSVEPEVTSTSKNAINNINKVEAEVQVDNIDKTQEATTNTKEITQSHSDNSKTQTMKTMASDTQNESDDNDEPAFFTLAEGCFTKSFLNNFPIPRTPSSEETYFDMDINTTKKGKRANRKMKFLEDKTKNKNENLFLPQYKQFGIININIDANEENTTNSQTTNGTRKKKKSKSKKSVAETSFSETAGTTQSIDNNMTTTMKDINVSHGTNKMTEKNISSDSSVQIGTENEPNLAKAICNHEETLNTSSKSMINQCQEIVNNNETTIKPVKDEINQVEILDEEDNLLENQIHYLPTKERELPGKTIVVKSDLQKTNILCGKKVEATLKPITNSIKNDVQCKPTDMNDSSSSTAYKVDNFNKNTDTEMNNSPKKEVATRIENNEVKNDEVLRTSTKYNVNEFNENMNTETNNLTTSIDTSKTENENETNNVYSSRTNTECDEFKKDTLPEMSNLTDYNNTRAESVKEIEKNTSVLTSDKEFIVTTSVQDVNNNKDSVTGKHSIKTSTQSNSNSKNKEMTIKQISPAEGSIQTITVSNITKSRNKKNKMPKGQNKRNYTNNNYCLKNEKKRNSEASVIKDENHIKSNTTTELNTPKVEVDKLNTTRIVNKKILSENILLQSKHEYEINSNEISDNNVNNTVNIMKETNKNEDDLEILSKECKSDVIINLMKKNNTKNEDISSPNAINNILDNIQTQCKNEDDNNNKYEPIPSTSRNDIDSQNKNCEPIPSTSGININSQNKDCEPIPSTNRNDKNSQNEDCEPIPSTSGINTNSQNKDCKPIPSTSGINRNSQNKNCEPVQSTSRNDKSSQNKDCEPIPSTSGINRHSHNKDCEPIPSTNRNDKSSQNKDCESTPSTNRNDKKSQNKNCEPIPSTSGINRNSQNKNCEPVPSTSRNDKNSQNEDCESMPSTSGINRNSQNKNCEPVQSTIRNDKSSQNKDCEPIPSTNRNDKKSQNKDCEPIPSTSGINRNSQNKNCEPVQSTSRNDKSSQNKDCEPIPSTSGINSNSQNKDCEPIPSTIRNDKSSQNKDCESTPSTNRNDKKSQNKDCEPIPSTSGINRNSQNKDCEPVPSTSRNDKSSQNKHCESTPSTNRTDKKSQNKHCEPIPSTSGINRNSQNKNCEPVPSTSRNDKSSQDKDCESTPSTNRTDKKSQNKHCEPIPSTSGINRNSQNKDCEPVPSTSRNDKSSQNKDCESTPSTNRTDKKSQNKDCEPIPSTSGINRNSQNKDCEPVPSTSRNDKSSQNKHCESTPSTNRTDKKSQNKHCEPIPSTSGINRNSQNKNCEPVPSTSRNDKSSQDKDCESTPSTNRTDKKSQNKHCEPIPSTSGINRNSQNKNCEPVPSTSRNDKSSQDKDCESTPSTNRTDKKSQNKHCEPIPSTSGINRNSQNKDCEPVPSTSRNDKSSQNKDCESTPSTNRTDKKSQNKHCEPIPSTSGINRNSQNKDCEPVPSTSRNDKSSQNKDCKSTPSTNRTDKKSQNKHCELIPSTSGINRNSQNKDCEPVPSTSRNDKSSQNKDCESTPSTNRNDKKSQNKDCEPIPSTSGINRNSQNKDCEPIPSTSRNDKSSQNKDCEPIPSTSGINSNSQNKDCEPLPSTSGVDRNLRSKDCDPVPSTSGTPSNSRSGCNLEVNTFTVTMYKKMFKLNKPRKNSKTPSHEINDVKDLSEVTISHEVPKAFAIENDIEDNSYTLEQANVENYYNGETNDVEESIGDARDNENELNNGETDSGEEKDLDSNINERSGKNLRNNVENDDDENKNEEEDVITCITKETSDQSVEKELKPIQKQIKHGNNKNEANKITPVNEFINLTSSLFNTLSEKSNNKKYTNCPYCGDDLHVRSNCPAFSFHCHDCHRVGHFTSMCTGDYFVNTTNIDNQNLMWTSSLIPIKLNNVYAAAIITTGCTQSYIDKKLAAALNAKTLKRPKDENNPESGQEIFCRATLNCDAYNYEVEFNIEENLPADVILEKDIWLKLHRDLNRIAPASIFTLLSRNCTPVSVKSKRYVGQDKKFISDEIDKLLKDAIIEPSTSPWKAQVAISSANLKKQFHVDYSQTINMFTELDSYHLPSVESMIYKLCNSNYFTKINLRNFYNQIPIEYHQRQYTAFEANGTSYQFTRIPYGVLNGTIAFHRAIQNIIHVEELDETWIHLDTLIVCGDSEETHNLNLEKFIKVASKYGIFINESNKETSGPLVNIMGYIIEHNHVRPSSERLSPLLELPTPIEPSEMRRSLIMFRHYARWISNFESKIAPLAEHGNVYPLPKNIADLFVNIKREVAATALIKIDGNELFTVEPDTSMHTITTTLSQNYRPVAFFFRKLQGPEYHYTNAEKEAMAVVEALKQWRHYLCGRHFLILTDYREVADAYCQIAPSGKNKLIEKWRIEFQSMKYDIATLPPHDR